MAKRDRAAAFLERTGLLSALETLPGQSALAVLNYHRIGHFADTPYDPDVFSASEEEFDEQIRILKRRWPLLSLEEVVDLLESKRSPRGLRLLLTFDDGYLDNYTSAFPVLKSHRVSAVFFLATGYIGTARIPWWDKLAWLLFNTRRDEIRLYHPEQQVISLRPPDRLDSFRRLLHLYKGAWNTEPDRFLSELSAECNLETPTCDPGLFMNWDQAAEMVAGGMSLGGHTVSHPVLSNLSRAEQAREVAECRQHIETRTGARVLAFAYPVGSARAFTSDTKAIAEESGYSVAFSYHGGINPWGAHDRMDMKRMSVDSGMSVGRIRLDLAIERFRAGGQRGSGSIPAGSRLGTSGELEPRVGNTR